MPDNIDPMVQLLANRQAHPPTPGGPRGPSMRPGAAIAPPMGGAVPTKPIDPSIIEQLLQLLGLGNMMGMKGGRPPVPSGPGGAQGVVDTIGSTVMAPAKRGMDVLQNLGQ